MTSDIKEFTKGCGTCQSTKPRTNQPKVPQNLITPEHSGLPFGTIALDFITKLLISNDCNTILTITDHDCSKVALFFPCKEVITAKEVAELYATHIFPHFGIPRKIISDRDPWFMSSFTRTLCERLRIKQNLSSAFHPQTDGQLERTNQWVEQYLRIYGNHNATDWAQWLPIAQFVHNSWMNETTRKTPFDLLIRVTPSSHYPMPEQPALDDKRLDRLQEVRAKAEEAVLKAQDVTRHKKITKYVPYKEKDQVWLEGKNLKTTHPTAKLAPKQYRPFTIKKKISDIIFQLELPEQWRIHNVFHTSLLSPYLETDIHGPNYPKPPPDIIEGEPEFEVEQIVGSRCIGRKKTLQYKVRWKGYAPAHDSWEPANQIHAPKLVKRYETEIKARSSQKKHATINSTSASGTLSRSTPCDHHYQSPLAEPEWSLTDPETLKASKSGKRIQESRTTPKEETNQPSSSDKDKKRTTPTKTAIPTLPATLHINQCTMDSLPNPFGYPLSFEEAA